MDAQTRRSETRVDVGRTGSFVVVPAVDGDEVALDVGVGVLEELHRPPCAHAPSASDGNSGERRVPAPQLPQQVQHLSLPFLKL